MKLYQLDHKINNKKSIRKIFEKTTNLINQKTSIDDKPEIFYVFFTKLPKIFDKQPKIVALNSKYNTHAN